MRTALEHGSHAVDQFDWVDSFSEHRGCVPRLGYKPYRTPARVSGAGSLTRLL
jgi:hypothetical protein